MGHGWNPEIFSTKYFSKSKTLKLHQASNNECKVSRTAGQAGQIKNEQNPKLSKKLKRGHKNYLWQLPLILLNTRSKIFIRRPDEI